MEESTVSPPRSRPPLDTEFATDDTLQRRLEVTVLTQMRDSMALIMQDLRSLGAELKDVNSNVIALLAAKYDEQIAETKRQFDRDIHELKDRITIHERKNEQAAQDQEVRMRDHDRQLARLGLGFAIAATVGGSALGAVIVLAVTQIFK